MILEGFEDNTNKYNLTISRVKPNNFVPNYSMRTWMIDALEEYL